MTARPDIAHDQAAEARPRLRVRTVGEAWPMGLRRETAAAYVGISPSKFDDWVARGLMPAAKQQDGVVLWVRRHLDLAIEALPDKQAIPTENPYRNQSL